jgi:hypothetical protein
MRTCQHCGEPIAPRRRIDARFCDASCRSAARHARTAISTPTREVGRQGTAAGECGQKRASDPPGRGTTYMPPPEWAWVAAYYASRSRSSEDAT